MLRAAEEALAHRRAEFITDVGRIQPEEALVLETIGSVQAFLGAIRRTPGLEWLAEAAGTATSLWIVPPARNVIWLAARAEPAD